MAITAALQNKLRDGDFGQLWTLWLEAPCSAQLLRAMEAVLDGASYQLNPAQSSNTALVVRIGASRALTAQFGIPTLLTRCYAHAWKLWPGTFSYRIPPSAAVYRTVILHARKASAGLIVSAGPHCTGALP